MQNVLCENEIKWTITYLHEGFHVGWKDENIGYYRDVESFWGK